MKNLGTIGSEIIFDHHIGDLKDFVIVHDSGRRSAYGSSDKNMRGSSILSSIYGGFDNDVFVRLESAFRAIEKENELLREKYIRWQKERPNVHGVEDRDRIIDTLEKRIVELQSENNRYKTQGSVSVNISGNMEDAENKIRSLNNRIIDLEAQLRNARSSSSAANISASSGSGNVQEYEIKIRTLNSRIQ